MSELTKNQWIEKYRESGLEVTLKAIDLDDGIAELSTEVLVNGVNIGCANRYLPTWTYHTCLFGEPFRVLDAENEADAIRKISNEISEWLAKTGLRGDNGVVRVVREDAEKGNYWQFYLGNDDDLAMATLYPPKADNFYATTTLGESYNPALSFDEACAIVLKESYRYLCKLLCIEEEYHEEAGQDE